MIKPTDLRIGNLVNIFPFNEAILFTVTAENLSERIYETVTLDTEKRLVHILETDIMRGIPLTEEWLLKFGFEKKKRTDKNLSFNREGINLFLWTENPSGDSQWQLTVEFESTDPVQTIPNKKVQHVHSLQNFWYYFTDEGELSIVNYPLSIKKDGLRQ
jgi:hypothetical protein